MVEDPPINADPVEANLEVQTPVEVNEEVAVDGPASPPVDAHDSGVLTQPHIGEQTSVVQEAIGDELVE